MLTSFVIPKSVTSLRYGVFLGCTNLKDIYCYAENVPDGKSAFQSFNLSNATLHVSEATLTDYKSTEPWSKFGNIVPLKDGDPGVEKCATPTIAVVDGKCVLDCETEDVKYACKIEFENEGNVIGLPSTVKISVYATKEGCEPSDNLTLETTPQVLFDKFGDVNGDGIVNGTDIQEVINIIVNGGN